MSLKFCFHNEFEILEPVVTKTSHQIHFSFTQPHSISLQVEMSSLSKKPSACMEYFYENFVEFLDEIVCKKSNK